MNHKVDRRSFIKKAAAIGVSSLMGSNVITRLSSFTAENPQIDIAAVKGEDYFNNTIKAVDLLGGIKNFVSKGSRVGLLVNSPWKNPGTYTNPDIVLAVIKMCYQADVKEIISLESVSSDYWNRTVLSKKFGEELKSLKSARKNHTKFEIPKGKNLKEAHIEKALLDCDVFINIPKIKDHAGTKFSGCLKNMMGATAYQPTNHFIHFGNTGKTWQDGGYENVEWLSQCISDLALVRTPDLCIADASEILLTNGPAGPGKLTKSLYLVAGTNPVAVDTYCAKFVNLTGKEIILIKNAAEHGLGEMNLAKLKIKEV